MPGESHGQRSLAGYSPWGCKEKDMTEWLTLTYFLYFWNGRGVVFGSTAPSTGYPTLLQAAPPFWTLPCSLGSSSSASAQPALPSLHLPASPDFRAPLPASPLCPTHMSTSPTGHSHEGLCWASQGWPLLSSPWFSPRKSVFLLSCFLFLARSQAGDQDINLGSRSHPTPNNEGQIAFSQLCQSHIYSSVIIDKDAQLCYQRSGHHTGWQTPCTLPIDSPTSLSPSTQTRTPAIPCLLWDLWLSPLPPPLLILCPHLPTSFLMSLLPSPSIHSPHWFIRTLNLIFTSFCLKTILESFHPAYKKFSELWISSLRPHISAVVSFLFLFLNFHYL